MHNTFFCTPASIYMMMFNMTKVLLVLFPFCIFTYVVKKSCDNTLFNWKGEIQSPNNSTNNPDVNCTWTIKTDPLRRIALSARTFNVKSGVHCMCNYFIVHDGKKTMRFCGQYFPTLYSETNQLIVKSYGHVSESVFHFDYQTYFKGKLIHSYI